MTDKTVEEVHAEAVQRALEATHGPQRHQLWLDQPDEAWSEGRLPGETRAPSRNAPRAADAPGAVHANYSVAELEQMLELMDITAGHFYTMAQAVGLHQFLEFTGFLREYTKICRKALDAGIDFGTTETLPMNVGEAVYIGEKFECIFGATFRQNPELIRVFCRVAFGLQLESHDDVVNDLAGGF